jgi:uncharacterized membrane protein
MINHIQGISGPATFHWTRATAALPCTAMAQPRTIGNMIAPWRFLVFIVALILAVPVARDVLQSLSLAAMAGFDVAAVLFLLLCIPLLQTTQAKAISEHAAANDANRGVLLILTGIVMLVLLFAIAAETMGRSPQPFTKSMIIATLAIAWIFSNTIYALHYAHLVYREGPNVQCSGLDFPGTPAPVYWDFIYFAFTLGMTFQTSDVTISDDYIRRVVTVHSLAAFVFNIGVLAFTINVLGSG